MAESLIAAGALYRAPAAGSVIVTSTLSFFAQAAEIGSNNPSVTKSNVTEAFSPTDPPPEGLRKLDSNVYARRSSCRVYSFRTERLNDDGLRCPGSLFDHADLVDRLAGRAQQLGGTLSVRGSGDENHADAAIEHALHLVLCDVAFALQPPKDFGPRPGRFPDNRFGLFRKDAGHIADQPAAGDVSQAFDGH